MLGFEKKPIVYAIVIKYNWDYIMIIQYYYKSKCN